MGYEMTLIVIPGRISRVLDASIAGSCHLLLNPSNFSSSGITSRTDFSLIYQHEGAPLRLSSRKLIASSFSVNVYPDEINISRFLSSFETLT